MQTVKALASLNRWVSFEPSSQKQNSHVLAQMVIQCHFVQAEKALASLHHCTKISFAASNGDLCAIHTSSEDSGESAHLHRLFWASSQYRNIKCRFKWRFVYRFVYSKCCSESSPATKAHLCNHKFVVPVRQKSSQSVVIKFLNKIFASLPRTKWGVVIVFCMSFHGNMKNSCA